jgi:hypothetical protein
MPSLPQEFRWLSNSASGSLTLLSLTDNLIQGAGSVGSQRICVNHAGPPNALRISRKMASVTNRIDLRASACVFPTRKFFLTLEVAMIRKAEGGYKVLSEKGKSLGGPYKSKKEAEKRLKQVEYFKHKKG